MAEEKAAKQAAEEQARTDKLTKEKALFRKAAKLLLCEKQLQELVAIRELGDDALAWAVASGVVMYKVPEAKAHADVVPITLLPGPFPDDLYVQAKTLAPDFHVLMDHIVCD